MASFQLFSILLSRIPADMPLLRNNVPFRSEDFPVIFRTHTSESD